VGALQRNAGLLVAAGLALSACYTQEISAEPVLLVDGVPRADYGTLQVSFAPRDATFQEQQANAAVRTASFYPFVDGRQLAWAGVDGAPQPFEVLEGATVGIGSLPAGPHHFEIRTAGKGPTVFAGEGEIAAASTTRFYLFGPAGAVEGRFVSFPDVVAAGTTHVSLINLLRTGQTLEVVGCSDGSHCAPLSAPLAVGDVFAADLRLDATQDWPNGRYVVSNGLGIGYRQVPNAAAPDPPVQPLPPDVYGLGAVSPNSTLTAAPIYMSPLGDTQASL